MGESSLSCRGSFACAPCQHLPVGRRVMSSSKSTVRLARRKECLGSKQGSVNLKSVGGS